MLLRRKLKVSMFSIHAANDTSVKKENAADHGHKDEIPGTIKDLKAKKKAASKSKKNAMKAMETVANEIIAAQQKENSDVMFSRRSKNAEKRLVKYFDGEINGLHLSGVQYNNLKSNIKSGNAHMSDDGYHGYVDSGDRHTVYRHYFTYGGKMRLICMILFR